ncbi:hypothetical protein LQE92_13745 [Lacrimispora sp. NSJ-141]|uniref:Uncharacterized protein n=1 Tax=Lientehia hominis TaxID=2897778 RepID=A0AAP2RL58_9FIRM|nr:hypothetical protein [Lientehia hominis]MCD2493669.1 hypothetical protein [Lientehia hominis]
MSTAFLDSFQLVIAVYLFYIAFKGKGQMYRFGNLSEEQQARVHKPLRILYTVGGFIALSEFGICALQSQMFTRSAGEGGSVTIIQNFTVKGLEFISYPFLSALSTILSLLVFGLLIGVVICLIRMGRRNAS